MRAPLRAQRVRGIPGVGLRTPDGREWLRWGAGHRWDPDSIDTPSGPGWVRARCAHRTGQFVRMDRDDTGLAWECCDACTEMETFRVQSCTRPGKFGNPWVVENHTAGWMAVGDDGPIRVGVTRMIACMDAVAAFASNEERGVASWPDVQFAVLARFDYLACWCPLDQPCHVDAIIREGRRRGVWT